MASISAMGAPAWHTPPPYQSGFPSPPLFQQYGFYDSGSGIRQPMINQAQMYQQPLFPSPQSHPPMHQQYQAYQQPQAYQYQQSQAPPGPSGSAARRPGPRTKGAPRKSDRVSKKKDCGTGGHL